MGPPELPVIDDPACRVGGSWLASMTARVILLDAEVVGMRFREVGVREVLRARLAGHGLRKVGEPSGVDRKTARRYAEAAQAADLTRPADSDGGLTSWSASWSRRSARSGHEDRSEPGSRATARSRGRCQS
jgi:hypothetical protein